MRTGDISVNPNISMTITLFYYIFYLYLEILKYIKSAVKAETRHRLPMVYVHRYDFFLLLYL